MRKQGGFKDNDIKVENNNSYFIISKQRKIVMDILLHTKEHPTAEMIYGIAKQHKYRISLATVYKNLKELVAEGAVVTLETEDTRLHYDSDLSNHAHFICKECGTIFDIYDTASTPNGLNEVAGRVDQEKRIYYGVCKQCL